MYGEVVRRARRARDLTQQQLADISGIKQANISAIERDQRMPSAETLHRLLASCGFELIATAGNRVIPIPCATDPRPTPPPRLTVDQRRRAVMGVLATSEAIVRGKTRG